MHHPDSPQCRDLPSTVRRARFQSITHAYDVLRGKRTQRAVHDPAMEELLRRRQYAYPRSAGSAYQHGGSSYAYDGSGRRDLEDTGDDRWKDRVIIFVGVVVRALFARLPALLRMMQSLGIALGPAMMLGTPGRQTHISAAANLAQARREAREHGEERRQEIKRRVEEYQEQAAAREASSGRTKSL